MKNQALKLAGAFALLLTLLFSSSAAHVFHPPKLLPGTCALRSSPISNPYTVKNNLTCPVKIAYGVHKLNGMACNFCAGGGPLSIAAGGSISITLPPGCQSVCNIVITLTEVNGNPITVIDVDKNNPSNGGSCGSCGCTSYSMSWTTGQTDIL